MIKAELTSLSLKAFMNFGRSAMVIERCAKMLMRLF